MQFQDLRDLLVGDFGDRLAEGRPPTVIAVGLLAAVLRPVSAFAEAVVDSAAADPEEVNRLRMPAGAAETQNSDLVGLTGSRRPFAASASSVNAAGMAKSAIRSPSRISSERLASSNSVKS